MRCPSCETFVSYDIEVEPEEMEEPTLEGTTFTAAYRRVLTCAECGEELKEYTFEMEADLTAFKMFDRLDEAGQDVYRDATEDEVTACTGADDQEHEWKMDDLTVSPIVDTITYDRNGKKIKSARYMKTLYGVEVSGIAKCEHCGMVVSVEVKDTVSASNMDELV